MIAERDRQQHSQPRVQRLDNPSQSTIGLQPLDSLQSPLAATLQPVEVIFDGVLPSATQPIFDTRLPQDLNPDWTNVERMREQVMSGRKPSEQSLDWLFHQFTGCDRPKSTLPHTGALNLTMETALFALGGLFATRTGTIASRDKLFYPKRNLTLDDFFEGWKEITASALEKIIALSKSVDRKSATLMGGGLPDTGLIRDFSKIWSKAMQGISTWSNAEINDMFQYPSGPGGAIRHREMVIERYLGEKEKAILTKAHHSKRAEKGIWFTNGSQEALRLFAESLIKQYNPTKSKPIEIVITDPTYPGFLLAIDKYLTSGVIKLRTVPIEKDGSINLEKLDEALEQSNKKYGREHAKILYLAEGNPMPKPYANLKDVARLLRNRHGDALVLEDRAYKGLGLENQDALIYHLPQQVMALETVSKSASPGEGLGIAYTGIKSRHASLLQKTVLADQYATDLGTRGVLTGSLYAILKHQHREFSKHREKVNRSYQEKRELYMKTYDEALHLAFGAGSYNLDDETSADIGMFGWRKTPVHSNIYARAGALIGLFSLPGYTCTPETRFVVDHANRQSESFYYMRQNHTWDSRRAIKIGIVKDVILELIYTENIPLSDKISAIYRLRNLAEKYNGGQKCREIDKFINLVAKHGWIIPEDLLPVI